MSNASFAALEVEGVSVAVPVQTNESAVTPRALRSASGVAQSMPIPPSPHPLAPCPPIRPRHSILLVFSEAGWYSSKTCRAVHAPEKVAIHLVPALCWHLETFTKNVQAAIFAGNTGEASVWTFRVYSLRRWNRSLWHLFLTCFR